MIHDGVPVYNDRQERVVKAEEENDADGEASRDPELDVGGQLEFEGEMRRKTLS